MVLSNHSILNNTYKRIYLGIHLLNRLHVKLETNTYLQGKLSYQFKDTHTELYNGETEKVSLTFQLICCRCLLYRCNCDFVRLDKFLIIFDVVFIAVIFLFTLHLVFSHGLRSKPGFVRPLLPLFICLFV